MPYSNLLKGRASLKNQIYHVTWSTHERKPVFKNLQHARTLIKSLKFAHDNDWCESLCFCVMPDHVHWLIALNNKSLDQILSSIKGYSTKAICKGSTEQLWHRGYYDRAIRYDEDITSIARYIVANPLRSKLVNNVRDYPYWDAVWLC